MRLNSVSKVIVQLSPPGVTDCPSCDALHDPCLMPALCKYLDNRISQVGCGSVLLSPMMANWQVPGVEGNGLLFSIQPEVTKGLVVEN